MRKYKFKINWINLHSTGHWYKCMLHWTIVQVKIQEKVIAFKDKKVYKNLLFITKCKLTNLDFVITFKKSYGTCTQYI